MKTKIMFALGLCGSTVILCLYWIRSDYFEINKTHKLLGTFRLRNPHLFKPYLTPTQPCTIETGSRVVIIVTSYVGHVELRSAHRQAMPQEFLNKLNTTRFFLLAQIPPTEKSITQKEITNESERFGDILQGSFVENYRNLTYKHLMGLHWAGTRCSRSKYIVKVDDDTVFDYEKIHSILGDYNPNEPLMVGYVLNGTQPRRNRVNKWYVSSAEYPHAEYPPYLSGWLYITTPATATALVSAAAYHPYFWIDDVFITGILTAELNIKITDLSSMNIWFEYYELLECCLRDMIEKKIKCEYAVAPNGGRNNLIVEFNKALRLCRSSSECRTRSDGQSVNKKCVVEGERRVFGNGDSQVRVVHL